MRLLLSKLIAGGLSAAAILLWWPHVFATDGPASWLARGVIWTLSFELLLLALAPLEEALWDHTRAGRALTRRASTVKARTVGHDSPRRRLAALALLAAFTLAVPLGLIAQGEPVLAAKPRPVQRTVHVTKVVRVVEPVRVQKVIERVEVPVRTQRTVVVRKTVHVRDPAPAKRAAAGTKTQPDAHTEPSAPTPQQTAGPQDDTAAADTTADATDEAPTVTATTEQQPSGTPPTAPR